MQLIYDAGVSALSQQDGTLSNLRNRTTAIITTAGLVTSFATGLGLINIKATSGPLFPRWGAYTLIGLLLAIGLLSLYVLWPVRQFAFGPSSTLMYERYQKGDHQAEIVTYVVEEMNKAQTANERRIHRRMRTFELAAVLLIAEFVVVIVASVAR